MHVSRQLILDLETTGLKAADGHRIIEFAALEMLDRQLTGNYLQLYINPERSIDAGATEIHGISNDMVADKPTFAAVAEVIAKYIDGSELIIHNAKFDMSFLDYQFNLMRLKMPQLKTVNSYITGVVDTLLIARQKFPGSRNTLDALCDRFKVNRDERTYHGALIDCQLLAQVYLSLTKEQINLLEVPSASSANYVKPTTFSKLDVNGLNLPVITPSDEEYELHNAYLRTLDKLSHGKSPWFNKIQDKHPATT